MPIKKILLGFAIAALITLWFSFDLSQWLTLENAKAQQAALNDYIIENATTASLVFFAGYVVMTALSLPGAAVASLLGAALFGFWWALVLVSFASSIGATLAFLVSRFMLRDWVQAKFGNKLDTINRGIEKDGSFYLLTLRLIPIFPFFLINLVMGLTPFKTRNFYWVSQLGMLPGTAVYVNAGTQLAQIDALGDVVSPSVLGSLALLGVFPLLAKWVMAWITRRKRYQGWNKPQQFDRNMVVIGAGAGGLVSSYIAAVVKAKVTLVEKGSMGGDCLNTGCVPSKALIRAAKTMREIGKAKTFGIHTQTPAVDFSAVMARVKQVITHIEPHDSVERYTKLGVECVQGEAHIVSPWEVEVNGERLTTRNIVIATGARPMLPPIPGLAEVTHYTSDTIWSLTELPSRLLVLGGGPIGAELAQSFSCLGSQVTLAEMADQLLSREDKDAAKLVEQALEHDGVTVLTQHKVKAFEHSDNEQIALLDGPDGEKTVAFDAVLVALGRSANTKGFGLEKLDIPVTDRGTIQVNEYLQTAYPNIYAVGDVAGPFQLTHASAHQAWYAAVNALFGQFKRFRADYSVMPAATYTSPEVARVGINEKEAKANQQEVEVTYYGIDDLDRAIADGNDHGFIKVLTPKGKDTILGVTIVGEHAGDLLAEFTLAMRHGLGLNKILGTVHPYPTMSEAVKYTAGMWKQAHAPEKLLNWVEKYHRWMRH
ncbi:MULTISPECIES: dihydrolipoyl dehydrogenase [unclassified Salinivibrio]|uniref:dihydrolipoyl dehydrogenase n=1 Tax=unclassified Salinivibrio TaxID=2636825 RepID=UPI00128DB79E|nr:MULTISPECIES: dihydrolipoyl dehydrogenase [unclassified Salinivibrio]MPS31701.1 dihydrolipoyl dehydrogenase [Salinivibrio sp. VYel7]MPX90272.1 dihydrolipoyl dehydrogenase [Salinivibrio sp. VYel1]MPX93096.1 dihydrolipoyl dehydrogenase [Salinivibrio sp. VYel9]MPX95220.1 dihydrolipoyl dehydrogenase [Salinivibrio sp. VYel6]MPX99314.1 dihydrolipoyl dehydrogenase [Salinivibrio sp. VYel4]